MGRTPTGRTPVGQSPVKVGFATKPVPKWNAPPSKNALKCRRKRARKAEEKKFLKEAEKLKAPKKKNYDAISKPLSPSDVAANGSYFYWADDPNTEEKRAAELPDQEYRLDEQGRLQLFKLKHASVARFNVTDASGRRQWTHAERELVVAAV